MKSEQRSSGAAVSSLSRPQPPSAALSRPQPPSLSPAPLSPSPCPGRGAARVFTLSSLAVQVGWEYHISPFSIGTFFIFFFLPFVFSSTIPQFSRSFLVSSPTAAECVASRTRALAKRGGVAWRPIPSSLFPSIPTATAALRLVAVYQFVRVNREDGVRRGVVGRGGACQHHPHF